MGATEITPSPRSSRNQGKLLQIQVQKLTQELKQQKEQAHQVRGPGSWAEVGLGGARSEKAPPHLRALLEQEKVHLEEQLVETTTLLKKVEAQLEAFQRSCLLQLASSSWLGRTLKSSTGSVEVSLCPWATLLPLIPSPAPLGLPRQPACPIQICASAGGLWPAWEACPAQAVF